MFQDYCLDQLWFLSHLVRKDINNNEHERLSNITLSMDAENLI
jgi:hypothetical protein